MRSLLHSLHSVCLTYLSYLITTVIDHLSSPPDVGGAKRWIPIYKSEIKRKTLNPDFDIFDIDCREIPLLHDSIRVEVDDYDDDGEFQHVGSFEHSLKI